MLYQTATPKNTVFLFKFKSLPDKKTPQ